MKLFSGTGTTSYTVDGHAMITLADSSMSSVFIGTAPITDITISQRVDTAISKGLDLDFFITTFGDAPVDITLEGVSLLNICDNSSGGGGGIINADGTSITNRGYSSDSNAQLMEFYRRNKISASNHTRLNLGIAAQGEKGQFFTCVMVSLTARASAKSPNSYNYTLKLLGVSDD